MWPWLVSARWRSSMRSLSAIRFFILGRGFGQFVYLRILHFVFRKRKTVVAVS